MNILITGGARGIGEGIVATLARAGHNVAFCGRNAADEYTAKAAAIAREYSINCRYYVCDVAREADRAALIASFLADFGSIDALVNNAGVAPLVRADLLEMSAESFDRVLDINLKGPFFLTQAVANTMLKESKSSFRCIVNIGSVSADYASTNRGEYCLSKAAVAMATKLYAARLADEGICVYEVRPGIIRSDMTAGVAKKYDALIESGLTLQRRWGTPEDVGSAVLALVSGAFAYSTGQVVNVDGGMTVERL